jgi:hypothetical protein
MHTPGAVPVLVYSELLHIPSGLRLKLSRIPVPVRLYYYWTIPPLRYSANSIKDYAALPTKKTIRVCPYLRLFIFVRPSDSRRPLQIQTKTSNCQQAYIARFHSPFKRKQQRSTL